MHALEKEGWAVVAIFVLVCAYLFLPPFGTYRLKSGQAACPTKESVVEYRGARIVGGLWAKARVIAARKCVTGDQTFKVMRRSTFFDLPHKINWGGVVMYADHDAIEEI